MTETSKEKTKRKQLKYITEYKWVQQTSLFAGLTLDNYDKDCELARTVIVEYLQQFKDKLRKSYKNIGFLVMIKAKITSNDKIKESYGRKPVHQIYVTVYSSKSIKQDELQELADSVYGAPAIKVRTKTLTTKKLVRSARSTKKQELHNIKKLLGENGSVNRYAVLNKTKLISRPQSLLVPVQSLAQDECPF